LFLNRPRRREAAVRRQTADWISPVNAARTASSTSASVKLQPRNNPLKEDAALLNRYAVGGGPDGPKLRIGEPEHAAIVFGKSDRLMTVADLRPGSSSLRKETECHQSNNARRSATKRIGRPTAVKKEFERLLSEVAPRRNDSARP
jgi:hypothetical protein